MNSPARFAQILMITMAVAIAAPAMAAEAQDQQMIASADNPGSAEVHYLNNSETADTAGARAAVQPPRRLGALAGTDQAAWQEVHNRKLRYRSSGL